MVWGKTNPWLFVEGEWETPPYPPTHPSKPPTRGKLKSSLIGWARTGGHPANLKRLQLVCHGLGPRVDEVRQCRSAHPRCKMVGLYGRSTTEGGIRESNLHSRMKGMAKAFGWDIRVKQFGASWDLSHQLCMKHAMNRLQ